MYCGNTAGTQTAHLLSQDLRNYLKPFVSRAIDQNPHAGLKTIAKIVKAESSRGSYSTVESMYHEEQRNIETRP
jgi:hypothetical protein